jgi:hypothetical protein
VFVGQTVGAIEKTTLALMDLPPLRDADDDLGFYYGMAGASDAWRGGALYQSADGVSYAQVASSDAPTPMGFATTALPSGPTGARRRQHRHRAADLRRARQRHPRAEPERRQRSTARPRDPHLRYGDAARRC